MPKLARRSRHQRGGLTYVVGMEAGGKIIQTHRIYIWYIYPHLAEIYGFHAGRYASPMNPMGNHLGFT